MAFRLLVDNLGPNVSSDDLRSLFAAFGEVRGVTLRRAAAGAGHHGFAYVDMGSAAELQSCVKGISGELAGRPLKLRVCTSPQRVDPAEGPAARLGGSAAAISSIVTKRQDALTRAERLFHCS